MRLIVTVLSAVIWLWALPCAAQITQQDQDAAKAHYLAGSAYYDQANYGDAAKEFSEAFRLSHRADLLYNIAVCYERLSQWDDAIGALRRYLTDKPDAADRAVIESRISNYEHRRDEAKAKAAAAAQPPPPPVAPAPPPPPKPRHLASYVVGGIGLGVLGVALGTGVQAQLDYNDLNNKCPKMVCSPSLRSEGDSGKSLAVATDVLIGVGAAAVATGVVLFIVELRKPAGGTRAMLAPAQLAAR
jgi:tetratricopeptide (TPR) repeat protein